MLSPDIRTCAPCNQPLLHLSQQPREAARLPHPAGALPPIARLWNESERRQQKARIGGLHLQVCDVEAREAWNLAREIQQALRPDVRVDLPGPRLFARILGLYRSVAALKHRAIWELELSIQDIADALNYSKSAVAAALRWLGINRLFTAARWWPGAWDISRVSGARRRLTWRAC